MTGISTYLSISILNANGLNSQIKAIDYQTGLKSKTQQFVVYKKPMLQTEIKVGLGGKD
jgi:hypothetical protein